MALHEFVKFGIALNLRRVGAQESTWLPYLAPTIGVSSFIFTSSPSLNLIDLHQPGHRRVMHAKVVRDRGHRVLAGNLFRPMNPPNGAPYFHCPANFCQCSAPALAARKSRTTFISAS